MQDECHLIWGDACGYAWLKRNEKVEIPMTNFRYRQTYYGVLNPFSTEFQLFPFDKANQECTLTFLEKILEIHKDKRILMIWDGAPYHRSGKIKEFLETINKDLEPENWKLTLMRFAPNAPEQNPVEDVWLQGKNFIRKNFQHLNTFAETKKAFFNSLNDIKFTFNKFNWYYSF